MRKEMKKMTMKSYRSGCQRKQVKVLVSGPSPAATGLDRPSSAEGAQLSPPRPATAGPEEAEAEEAKAQTEAEAEAKAKAKA